MTSVSPKGTPAPSSIFNDNGSRIYVSERLGGESSTAVAYTKVQSKFNCLKCSVHFDTRRKFLIHLFTDGHLRKILCKCEKKFTYTTFQEHIKKNGDCREYLNYVEPLQQVEPQTLITPVEDIPAVTKAVELSDQEE